MNLIDSLSLWALAWIVAVMLLAGFMHGAIGFGLPIIATPLLALVLDLKTAVLVTIVPTMTMGVISVLSGGKLRESIGRFWYLPVCLVAGSYVGTRILIAVDAAPFILVLAGTLFAYLNLDRLGKAEVPAVKRHPLAAGLVFGFVAGVFESTVNVSGPVLLVYFMLLGISPVALVQTLNFCFLGGKLMQALTWSTSGGIGFAQWLSTAPWALLAATTFFAGQRLRGGVSPATYLGWLRKFLWTMVALLAFQYIRMMIERA
ncbi:MAG: sulfite exporter TauE/SafE family protein [Betaproteobacteria bacterium]|nr:sulfite exporter TauE/SafE family protein [Betaproteobacteria bacterium]